MSEKIAITVNGKVCQGVKGQTILDIAEANGISIPNLCHNGELAHYGGCSLCICEVEGSNKLLRACSTEASDGQVVDTESERVVKARKVAIELLMSDHSGDCQGPCVIACPGHVKVQSYVRAIAAGDNLKAVQIIKRDLPIPASIGRICPHPCEEACRRQNVEDSISIACLKFSAADDVISKGGWMPEKAEPTGKKIAVIGGGPGGLTAAFYGALSGHNVTIFDAMPKMGGMLRYGIPEYRLPKSVLDSEIAEIESLGVEMRNSVRVGSDITLSDIRRDHDAVVVAIGAWKSTPLNCEGDTAEGVIDGIRFLRDVAEGNAPEIGDDVIIVGGGNTAMDACRTAVRLGAKKVRVIYRRTEAEMPADKLEIREAREEGVGFEFLRNPAEIIADEDGRVREVRLQIMALGEPDESGRRRPVPVEGEFHTMPASTIIAAIGQKVDVTGLEELSLNTRGIIAADEHTFLTNLDGVFAVGDATNKGASIAIEAIGEAHHCMQIVDGYLAGECLSYHEKYMSQRNLMKGDPEFEGYIRHPRLPRNVRPAEERKEDFLAIDPGYQSDQMLEEASRCLECGCFDYRDCKLIKYANLYEIHPERLDSSKHRAYMEHKLAVIQRDQGKCVLCGQCVRICDEVVGKGILGLVGRGFGTDINPIIGDIDIVHTCSDCLKCAYACPTGALRILTDVIDRVGEPV